MYTSHAKQNFLNLWVPLTHVPGSSATNFVFHVIDWHNSPKENWYPSGYLCYNAGANDLSLNRRFVTKSHEVQI